MQHWAEGRTGQREEGDGMQTDVVSLDDFCMHALSDPTFVICEFIILIAEQYCSGA